MKLFPTKRQWAGWSLPSKASYFSAVLAVLTLGVGVANYLSNSRLLDLVEGIISEEISFSELDNEVLADIYVDLDRKIENDFSGINSTSILVAIHYLDKCSRRYSTEYDSFDDLFLARALVVNSAPDHYYNTDNMYVYRENIMELGFSLIDRVNIHRMSAGIDYFRYYRDQIERSPDYEERLREALILLETGPNRGETGGMLPQTKFVEAKQILGITPYDHECMRVREFGPSLEDWIFSFWVRRFGDGTYEQFSWLLDQALAVEENSEKASPMSLDSRIRLLPPAD